MPITGSMLIPSRSSNLEART